MASHDELKTALMETLEKRGVVGELKAKIRQEIFAVLDESDVVKPKVRNIEFIIFSLDFESRMSFLLCERVCRFVSSISCC
jgi:lisH domain-containing protein FOPNL